MSPIRKKPFGGLVLQAIVVLNYFGHSIKPIDCSLAMKRLYEDLFTDYNRLILPISNNKTKVTVTLGLKLGQILDFNLKQQILSTNVWVEQAWHDSRLEWDPNLYQGINMIHVPAENIWIPDIVLFNNADGNYELTLVAKAALYSNGSVVWKPPTMFRSTCEVDVEYFPFDIQTCYLRFGSWTYAGDELEIKHAGNKKKVDIGIDLSQFYKNVEWDIIDVPAYYNEVYYECCQEPFPDVTFKIVIRRKMLFYLVNLILPVALMTFMTVSVFYLPSDSNEKVTLSISILTSLIVFFLLMLEIIPPTSLAVPLFGKYLLFTLVLVSLSACVSVYVLNIHHRSPSVHQMSPKMRQIFLKTLPRLLRLDRPDPRERSSLNRFRKKKLAQRLLQAHQHNKVYDLAQPLAASLNLIETLHKSYDFNPHDDDHDKQTDDEGRYFRRYVDNYISHLEKINNEKQQKPNTECNCVKMDRACCEHNKCCSRANQQFVNLQRPSSGHLQQQQKSTKSNNTCYGAAMDWTGNGTNSCNQQTYRSTSVGCTARQSQMGNILNDDTLDMTFDYDDQDNNNGAEQVASNFASCEAAQTKIAPSEDDLPSPPPPPRQLTQLNGSLKDMSGRLSSCSQKKLSTTSSMMHRPKVYPDTSVCNDDEEIDEDESNGKHEQLVDKLITSINLINGASDEMDTTTTTSNNDGVYNHLRTMPEARHVPFHTESISPAAFGSSFEETSQQIHRASALKCTCNSNGTDQNHLQSFYDHHHQQQHDQDHNHDDHHHQHQQQRHLRNSMMKDAQAGTGAESLRQPSDLLLSLKLPYDQMPPHVRAAIRSILFIADTIKNEDDENSAIEDWESMSMVVDRLFLWIFFLLCTFGSVIILALAPSLYDQRDSIDDKLRIEIPPSNCSALHSNKLL